MKIDPAKKGIVAFHFTLHNRKGGGLVLQANLSKDTQWGIAKEIRDQFLKSPAWKILKDREPDRKYVIDGAGKEMPQRQM